MEIRIVYTIFAGFILLSILSVAGLTILSHFSGAPRTNTAVLEADNTATVATPQQATPEPEFSTVNNSTATTTENQPAVLGESSSHLDDRQFSETLYSLLNAYRKEQGLTPLQVNPALEISAQAKLTDMKQNKYWSHVSPDGTQPWNFFVAAGYDYHYAGENLAFSHNTPWNVFTHWQESESHKIELLKPEYNHMGIALDCQYQSGAEYACVTVLHLGKRR
ncbi:MAG: CAP domain-containing protein [Patescibacteria group bacterium]